MSLPSDLLQRALSNTPGVDMAALKELGRELDWQHAEIATRPQPALVVVADVGPLGVATATLTLDGISQRWRHLWLIASLRSTVAATNEALSLRVNNDTGANYDSQRVSGNAGTASANEALAQTSCTVALVPGSTGNANDFGFIDVLFPDYANASKKRQWMSRYAERHGTATGTLNVDVRAGAYRTAGALTRLDLFLAAGSFEVGSRATLYGLT